MKRGAADGRPARHRAPHWHVRSAPPAPRRRRSPRRARALSVHRRRLSRPRRPTAARAKAGAARSEALICAGGVDVDGAAETNRPVAIARGVTSKMSSGSGTTAPGTPHAGEDASAPSSSRRRSGAPAHHPRAPGGAQGQGDPLPMRHRAARGRARRFPRRGVSRTERGEQGHAFGRCARAFRVQSAGHAVQRAARGVGVRGWDASRALGRAWRRPPPGGVARGGRGDHEGRRRVHRRGARAPRRAGRAARAPAAASPRAQVREGRQERRGGGKENGPRVQQLRMHVACDAAHAPRAQRRAIAVQRVRPMVRAAGAPCGRWRVVR